MRDIEFHTKGYEEAVKFLKETNRFYLVEKEFSTDGWTVIALANSLRQSDLKEKNNG